MSLTDENSLVLSFNIGPIYVTTSEIALKRSRESIRCQTLNPKISYFFAKVGKVRKILETIANRIFHKSVADI